MDKQTDGQTDGQTDDQITRCPQRTFQAEGIKIINQNILEGSRKSSLVHDLQHP